MLLLLSLLFLVALIARQAISTRRKIRQREEELIAWRFTQSPLELTPQDRAAGWQVMRFKDGAQCKILSDDTIVRRLHSLKAPFIPPESHVFEDEDTAKRVRLGWTFDQCTQDRCGRSMEHSRYETAEDLARRREALKDYEF